MSRQRASGRLERGLVAGLLLVLLWLPLPLGSNRPWAMALLVALVGVLALGWALGVLTQRITAGKFLFWGTRNMMSTRCKRNMNGI